MSTLCTNLSSREPFCRIQTRLAFGQHLNRGHFGLALCLHSPGIVQALVGDGRVAAASLQTPVNVLVILEPLGWKTDSVKKHLSTLRSWKWFTVYLDCQEFLQLDILSPLFSVCISALVCTIKPLGMQCHSESLPVTFSSAGSRLTLCITLNILSQVLATPLP